MSSAASIRPEISARLTAETGLDDDTLGLLVRQFYERATADAVLGPVFDQHVDDWETHFGRMTDFWSSVMLMTGRYHGNPLAKHMPLGLEPHHFERWLSLFAATAHETCPPEGAGRIIDRARKIAATIEVNLGIRRAPDLRALSGVAPERGRS